MSQPGKEGNQKIDDSKKNQVKNPNPFYEYINSKDSHPKSNGESKYSSSRSDGSQDSKSRSRDKNSKDKNASYEKKINQSKNNDQQYKQKDQKYQNYAQNKREPYDYGKEDSYYKTKLCPLFQKNICKKGNTCSYAHGQKQLRSLPNFKKTRLCIPFKSGECPKSSGECKYAHGEAQLRRINQNESNYRDRDYQTQNSSRGGSRDMIRQKERQRQYLRDRQRRQRLRDRDRQRERRDRESRGRDRDYRQKDYRDYRDRDYHDRDRDYREKDYRDRDHDRNRSSRYRQRGQKQDSYYSSQRGSSGYQPYPSSFNNAYMIPSYPSVPLHSTAENYASNIYSSNTGSSNFNSSVLPPHNISGNYSSIPSLYGMGPYEIGYNSYAPSQPYSSNSSKHQGRE